MKTSFFILMLGLAANFISINVFADNYRENKGINTLMPEDSTGGDTTDGGGVIFPGTGH